MKRFLPFTLLLLLVACNNETATIKDAAYGYCHALANYNLDEAELYCTEETKVSFLATSRYMISLLDTAYIAKDTPAEVDIETVERTSDTTALVHYRKRTPIKDLTYNLEMRKRDGKWLAHAPIGKNSTVAQ